MRRSWLASLSLFVILAWVSAGRAGTPACVRSSSATMKLSLRVPASGKKTKRKPSKQKDEALKVAQYTPLNWTGKREGKWIEVRDMHGKTFWVRYRDVSFSMKCLQVMVQKSRLRTGPGPSFERAPVAQRGDVFLDHGGEDGWTRVENAKGETAWINLDHTWRPATLKRMVFEPEDL